MKPSLLIFEPRLGGHHLTWMRYVTEDCLAGGWRVSLAADLRAEHKGIILDHFQDLSNKITLISAYGENGQYRGGSKTSSLELCFKESGADQILMTNFDEVASRWLRLAAFGISPPEPLRGKLNCVYFRPRFLANRWWPPGNIIKQVGFNRLCRNGWFRTIFLLDEYLCATAQDAYNPWTNISCLPDPWTGNYRRAKDGARKKLSVPADKFVFLHYGLGTRRKGLHLVIKAMQQDALKNGYLLAAGNIDDDRELITGLDRLEEEGKALVLNRYVSDEEEELCFAAADVVLLPYVGHFGSSAVLSRAAAAEKIVLASNEGLVAKRVQDHGLGLLFDSGKIDALAQAMKKVMDDKVAHLYQEAARRYAKSCTRQAFKDVLLQSLAV